MSSLQQQVADLHGRLATVTAQIEAAEAEHVTLLSQGDALIEAFAQGELTSAVFDERLTKLQDARLVNERRRETLATTRGRVGELLAEAEHAARIEHARQALGAAHEASPQAIRRYLESLRNYVLTRYELLELRTQIKRYTQELGGDLEGVPGPVIAWQKVNPFFEVPNAAQLDQWSTVARLLDQYNPAIEQLGGTAVYGSDTLGDIDVEPTDEEEEAYPEAL